MNYANFAIFSVIAVMFSLFTFVPVCMASSNVELYLSEPILTPDEPHRGDQVGVVFNFDIQNLNREAMTHMYLYIDNELVKHAYNNFYGGSHSYEFKMGTGGLSVGEHTAKVMVKVYDVGKASYVVQEASTVFDVKTSTFHIDIDKVEITPENPELGDTIRFKMRLDVEGELDDNEVWMKFLVNNVTRKKPVTSFDEGEHWYTIGYYLDPEYIHEMYNNFKIVVSLYDDDGNLKDYDTYMKRVRVEGDFTPEDDDDENGDELDEPDEQLILSRPSISINYYPKDVEIGERVRVYGYITDLDYLLGYAHFYIDDILIEPIVVNSEGYYEKYLTFSNSGLQKISVKYKGYMTDDYIYVGSERDENAAVIVPDVVKPYKITIIRVENVVQEYSYGKEFIDVYASQKEVDLSGDSGSILRVAITSHLKNAERIVVETNFDEEMVFLPDSEIIKPGERKYMDLYFAPSIDYGKYDGIVSVRAGDEIVAELPVSVFVLKNKRDALEEISTELFDRNISLFYLLVLFVIFAFVVITSIVKDDKRSRRRKVDVRSVTKLRDAVARRDDKTSKSADQDYYVVGKNNFVD